MENALESMNQRADLFRGLQVAGYSPEVSEAVRSNVFLAFRVGNIPVRVYWYPDSIDIVVNNGQWTYEDIKSYDFYVIMSKVHEGISWVYGHRDEF